MKYLHMVTFVLVVVGALNWGLVGLGWWAGGADWNLVHAIFGSWSSIEGLIYVLVGLSAIWFIVKHPKECKVCMSMGKPAGSM